MRVLGLGVLAAVLSVQTIHAEILDPYAQDQLSSEIKQGARTVSTYALAGAAGSLLLGIVATATSAQDSKLIGDLRALRDLKLKIEDLKSASSSLSAADSAKALARLEARQSTLVERLVSANGQFFTSLKDPGVAPLVETYDSRLKSSARNARRAFGAGIAAVVVFAGARLIVLFSHDVAGAYMRLRTKTYEGLGAIDRKLLADALDELVVFMIER